MAHKGTYAGLTKEKAGEMLRHGEVHGQPLTQKQRGLFGLIRGGGKPTRLHRAMRRLKQRRAQEQGTA